MRETVVKAEEFKDSPLGKILTDWEVFKLSEVVPRVEYGISVSLDDEVGIPVLRMNNLKDGEVDLTDLKKSASFKAASLLLQPLDVLFNRTNSIEHVGRTAIWRGQIEPASFASYLVRLIPDQSKLIPEYLNIWLNFPSTQLLIRRYATPGVHQVNINPTNLRKVLIPLPKEVSEQRRIVEIFGSINSTLAHTSSLIAKLKLMKAGLLHDLLTRGLDENGELRDAIGHPEQFKDSPLGQIPKDWDVPHLTKEIDIVHGYAFKGEYFADSPPGDVLLVPGNFHREGGLYFDENNTKYYRGEIPAITVLDNGELLIVMTDLSPRTLILGRVVQLQLPFQVLHNQRIGKIVPKLPDTWDKRFLMLVMNSDRVRRNIISNATGTTVRHTSPDRIMANIIPKPNIKEQSRIVEIIDTYDTRIRAEEAYRDKLKLQKKGLMHDLLTGKVRVKDADKFTPASDTV